MYAKPTSRVGIVGIGRLGRMAVKFAAAYGCEVTAFTSSESKFDEARKFGAHRVVLSCNPDAIAANDVVSLGIGEGIQAVYITVYPDQSARWSAAEVE